MSEFRKITKALSGHEDPKQAHTYEAIVFQEDGNFRRDPVPQHKTNVRLLDPTKTPYEVQDFGNSKGWGLIPEQTFAVLKAEWDQLREQKGKSPIDSDGNLI
jgi:hypothetical protein